MIEPNEEQKKKIEAIVKSPEWSQTIVPLLERYVSDLINVTKVKRLEFPSYEEYGMALEVRSKAADTVLRILSELNLYQKTVKETENKYEV